MAVGSFSTSLSGAQGLLTHVYDSDRMLGEVIEKAAELAESGQPTVEGALTRYEQVSGPIGSRARQVWVSVAFLLSRHARMAAKLPD